MWIVLIFVVILVLLYLFLIQCRSSNSGIAQLRGWAYAHRGLHGNGVPENSMLAFQLAKNGGYGIEFDVHLLSDGGLAVIHDASLVRTAGVDIQIEDLNLSQIKEYKLEGTEECIPTFEEVLELYAGTAPLIIELKVERSNYASLCQAVCKALEGYDGVYCIESFDPRCIAWLKENRSDVIRGQLSENYFDTPNIKLPWILKLALTSHLLNIGTRPDFIAYRFRDRKRLGNFLCRKLWGAQGVAWTIKSKEDYDTAVSEGWLPIFESFCP